MVEEERRKINTTALAVGGAVIAICGLGAYYIYSRSELLKRFMEAVEDYKQEYYEFAESNEGISEQEQQLLDVKRQKINTLMHEIEAKGLVEQAIDLLWAAGIVITVYYVWKLIAKIVGDYFKRHPRDPDTGNPPPDPSKPYKDVTDYTWHPTEDDLADHYRDVHPTPGTDPEAWDDVWRDIRGFPQWVIDLLASFNLDGLEDWVKYDYHELDPNVQLAIKLLIGVAIVLVCVLVGWYAPSVLERGRIILTKLDAIPS